MIGEVDNGISVRNCGVVQHQCVLIGQGVLHADPEGAGEIPLAVRAYVAECNGRLVAAVHSVNRPYALIVAVGAAVQCVGLIVLVKLIGLSGNRDLTIGNAVGVSSDEGAVAGIPVNVALERVVAKDYVRILPVPVRDLQTNYRAAEVRQPCNCAVAVRQREQPALVTSEKSEFSL